MIFATLVAFNEATNRVNFGTGPPPIPTNPAKALSAPLLSPIETSPLPSVGNKPMETV